jgi:hypothetical protein
MHSRFKIENNNTKHDKPCGFIARETVENEAAPPIRK